MRIWNFLIIYSCWSDGGLIDENDTAVDENLGEKKAVFLKDVLPKNEYKVVEKEEKKAKMKEKLKNAGKRKKRGRVVGGHSVRSNTEYPEYVSLKSAGGNHFCGGTILDANHILSAAHCRIEPRKDKSTAGTVEKSGTGGSTHILETCTKHPQAKRGKSTWEADYEICKLKTPIAIDGRTKKATQIGTVAEYNQYVKTGKASCVIVGMGRTASGGGSSSKPQLQKLSMKLKDRPGSLMKLFQPQNWGIVSESAEGSGKGGCKGDSGGPFFCTINGVRKQFGVASWADTKCGRITGWYQPGAVMSWIQQNSQYGGGSGSTSSSGSSSSSYNQQTTNNQYQQNRQQHHQQNRHNQQRPTTSHNSYNSNSGSSSQSAQRVKKELQKLRSQFDQMLALL